MKTINFYVLFLLSIFITGCSDGLVELDSNQSSAFAKRLIVAAGVNNNYNHTVTICSYYKKLDYEHEQSIIIIDDIFKRIGVSKFVDGDNVNINLKTDKKHYYKKVYS